MERLHRKPIVFRVTCLGALILLGSMSPALAQDDAPEPYTYVAEWTIARDQWQGYAEWAARNTRPILERLAADGTLLGWGFFETYVHTPDQSTHGLWWTAATFAGIEKTRTELVKAPFHPAAAAGAHRDYLLRVGAHGGRPGSVAGGFLYVNSQFVKPGQGSVWADLWEKNAKPVLDELVAAGALASYGVYTEDVHTETSTQRMIVTISTSAAAEDQIEAAFTAASAKRTEAERETLAQKNRELTDAPAHRDYMARVTAAWFK